MATLSEAEGLRDHNVYPIYQDRAGAIWIGAWPNTLNRYDGGKFRYFTERDGLVPYISALYEDRSGALWVGAYGSDRHDSGKKDGLRVFKNGRFVPPADLRGLGTVRAMLQGRHGTLWLGCEDKLVQYANGVVRTFTTRDGLATNYATVLVEDRSGDLWIGGQGGLTRFSGARFTAYTVRDGLPSPNVRVLYVDRENVLWIGTYDGGLGRFEDGQFTRYTTRDGLFSSGVFQILEDSRGYFWISSNQGIYRVRKGELNDFARGKTGSVTSIAYGKPDGMRNIESNGGHWPAGIRARDGKLWFPTQDGVAVIDPEQVAVNIIPPPVVIESCLVERRPVALDKPVRLSPAQTSFQIQYTAFSFANPERIHFKYKLDGLDRDWIDAGSRRTAYYSHLPPGDYRFKVIAANSDGVWNMQGTHLLIWVLPPFYRTWWFVSLMILAGAGAVLFGWQYRVSQLQRVYAAQQAFSRQLITSQERERRRIAGELHDSLGQSLVLIRNWARLGSSQLSPQSPAREELDEITATAAQAIHDVREIAYNLGPYHLDRLGLANTLKDMIHRVAQASAIRFTTQLDRLPGPLPREVEMNLFRIAQEATNNIVKHSEATEATVTVQQEADSIKLLITDNGKGFHGPSAVSSAGQSGFGLTGMEERVRLLNGMWAVRSAPGQGTTIEITLKAGNGDETASDSDRG